MMGEESVAQIFLGIVICTGWLCLLVQKKPYVAYWDNWVAIILAGHLLLTMVSGMALKLYSLTPGQNVYQRQGFGIVLLGTTIVCTVLSMLSIVVGSPLMTQIKALFQAKRNAKAKELEEITV